MLSSRGPPRTGVCAVKSGTRATNLNVSSDEDSNSVLSNAFTEFLEAVTLRFRTEPDAEYRYQRHLS